jgi:hypothetical protein
MGKKSRSGSGMNIPYHISESLETNFWVKILKFLDADPESFQPWIWDGNIRIRDKHPGSATLGCEGYRILYKCTCLDGKWGALEAVMRRTHL